MERTWIGHVVYWIGAVGVPIAGYILLPLLGVWLIFGVLINVEWAKLRRIFIVVILIGTILMLEYGFG